MRQKLLLAAFVAASLLFTGSLGCSSMQVRLTESENELAHVSMSAYVNRDQIEVRVRNDGPRAIRIIWADSTYVFQDGEADRLVPLELGDTNAIGDPRDETVPRGATAVTYVAPRRSIDPATGTVSIPWGPEGSQVRVVLQVAQGDRVGIIDKTYVFTTER